MSTSDLDIDIDMLVRPYHVPTLFSDPTLDERDLVERARLDADAFAELYRRYLPRVHAYVWRRTGSRETAEDLTSQVFEAALRGLPRYRWQPGGVAPWLFRIAANQVVAHYRREGRATTDRGQHAMATMTELTTDDRFTELLADDDTALVRRALTGLSPRYQRAIDLRYLAGLDHGDAARAMGLAKPAFAVVLSRALKALRRAIETARTEEAGGAGDAEPVESRKARRVR
ncbi:MAG: sigma-70 family RNA polymerase sigma factor [Actinomycetota bacterium]